MRAGLALACAALSAACVSTEHQSRDWSTYAGPGAAFFQAEEIEFPHVDDPLEPTNRAVAALNYGLLRYALAPVARVYRCVVPEVARERLERAGKNLAFPTRLVNNLLQGKVRRSGVEVARFAINTTVGGLGLFDPAQEWGLHPYPEDFGHACLRSALRSRLASSLVRTIQSFLPASRSQTSSARSWARSSP